MKNPIKHIFKAYRNTLFSLRESNRNAHEKSLHDSFIVDERNGRMYILHGGVAIMSFDQDENVHTIVETLNSCRSEAINYEYGREC